MNLSPPPSAMDRDAFVRRFGSLYENSPWVAERAYDGGIGPRHDTVEGLHRHLAATMLAAPRRLQLALIRAHPDLAGRAAREGRLTTASSGEQRSAGLDRLRPDELERLTALNGAYRDKFGFPFILAVRGLDPASVLAALERRLEDEPEHEFATALAQINRIALLRLEAS